MFVWVPSRPGDGSLKSLKKGVWTLGFLKTVHLVTEVIITPKLLHSL